MTPERMEEAARLFAAARGDVRLLEALPEPLRPADAAEGYAIQDAFARLWGIEVAGWKVACTAAEQQRFLGVDEPFSGRVFAPYLLESPATLASAAFHMRGLEGEFAFRLGRALPPRAEAYDRDEVAEAVAALCPAVEVVDPRFQDWLAVGAPSLIADNAVNGALVLGPGTEDWRAVDLERHAVRMTCNGETVGEGTGAEALGNPLNALAWLANNLSGRGLGLEAGQVVTTGTCTGIHPAPPGARARADFGDLGEVVLRFVD